MTFQSSQSPEGNESLRFEKNHFLSLKASFLALHYTPYAFPSFSSKTNLMYIEVINFYPRLPKQLLKLVGKCNKWTLYVFAIISRVEVLTEKSNLPTN